MTTPCTRSVGGWLTGLALLMLAQACKGQSGGPFTGYVSHPPDLLCFERTWKSQLHTSLVPAHDLLCTWPLLTVLDRSCAPQHCQLASPAVYAVYQDVCEALNNAWGDKTSDTSLCVPPGDLLPGAGRCVQHWRTALLLPGVRHASNCHKCSPS